MRIVLKTKLLLRHATSGALRSLLNMHRNPPFQGNTAMQATAASASRSRKRERRFTIRRFQMVLSGAGGLSHRLAGTIS
jgi:hypothetical protein